MAAISSPDRQAGIARAATRTEHTGRNPEQVRIALAHSERLKQSGVEANKQLHEWVDTEVVRNHVNTTIESKDPAKISQARLAEKKAREAGSKNFKDWAPGDPQRAQLITDAQTAISRIPELSEIKDHLNSLPPAAQEAVLADMLTKLDEDGDLGRAILGRRDEIFKNPRAKSEELTTSITELDKKKAEQTTINDKVTANDAAISENKTKVDDFDPSKITTLGTGANRLEQSQKAVNKFFVDLAKNPIASGLTQSQLKDYFSRKDTLNAEINAMSQAVAQAGRNKAPNLAALTDELNQMKHAKSVIDAYGGRFDAVNQPLQAVKNEKGKVETERDRLQAEKTNLTSSLATVNTEVGALQAKVDGLRKTEEDAYVKDIQDISQDAIKNLYLGRVMDAKAHDEAVHKAVIDQETDPMAKSLLEQMRDGRWRKIDEIKLARLRGILRGDKKFIGNHQVEEFNDGQIRTDLTLLKQGQDVLARNMLTSMVDATGNRLYSDTQINEFLASDKFKREGGTAEEITKQLLARAAQRGQLKPGDQEFIEATDWGKGLMEKAQSEHADWIEKQKKLMGFVGPTAEFIKKHPKIGWLALLMLIYPPAGVLLLGGVAVKNIVTSKAA